MVERPSASFALLFVAGILILFLGISVSGFFIPNPACAPKTTFAIFLDAIICGIAVLTAGILLYVLPKYHVIFGFLGFVFSVFSIFSGGGLGISMSLGIISAACGIDWKSGYSPTSLRYQHF